VGETEPGPVEIVDPETQLFLCECGRPDCMEYMEIDLETVRLFGANGRPMVVPEHQLPREAGTRERAADLREQARALRAQAQHQVARARRSTDRRND
jgi:hypothetical protein